MGQGGRHGDPALGCSMLLLHLLFVPKIEKSDLSLPASAAFSVHGSVGCTFVSPCLCVRTMLFLLCSETTRPLSNLEIEITRPKKASAHFSMCCFMSAGILHPAGRQRNGRGSHPGHGFTSPCLTCCPLCRLRARSQDQCSLEDLCELAFIPDCHHCSIPPVVAVPKSCYCHYPLNRYGA